MTNATIAQNLDRLCARHSDGALTAREFEALVRFYIHELNCADEPIRNLNCDWLISDAVIAEIQAVYDDGAHAEPSKIAAIKRLREIRYNLGLDSSLLLCKYVIDGLIAGDKLSFRNRYFAPYSR